MKSKVYLIEEMNLVDYGVAILGVASRKSTIDDIIKKHYKTYEVIHRHPRESWWKGIVFRNTIKHDNFKIEITVKEILTDEPII